MKRILILMNLMLFAATSAHAQVTQQWVARYDGLGNGRAYAMAADFSRNVIYVTGWSWSGPDRYGTVAYDTNGHQLWEARYSGADNSGSRAIAIAVNPNSGNVYVTGSSYSEAGRSDYATVAYDTNGNQLWVARYNEPGIAHAFAYAIAVDPNSGNVYVTGIRLGAVVTVAYDANGNQLWVARYGGSPNVSEVYAIAVHPNSGNVYLTGVSHATGNDDRYATVAYDANGNQLWVALYGGPVNHSTAQAIALNLNSGNVYVTGWSERVDYSIEYATVAYDSAGNQLWVARYSGPSFGGGAKAIAVNSGSGNVYVTGPNANVSSNDLATVAYDANGNELWVARYPTGSISFLPPSNQLIALDNFGNVYVTGPAKGVYGYADYATVAYDAGWDFLTIKYSQP